MNITNTYKVEVTFEELKEIMKKHLELLPEDAIDLTITQLEEQEEVKAEDCDEWIDVPPNWSEDRCPDDNIHKSDCFIQIQYRNGEYRAGNSQSWTNLWEQSNHSFDIVKYRLVR